MSFEQTALPFLEEHRAEYLAKARNLALELIKTRDSITVDDVRDLLPPPANFDPRVMGAIFKHRDWECVGYEKSTRSACHKRPIGRFRLR